MRRVTVTLTVDLPDAGWARAQAEIEDEVGAVITKLAGTRPEAKVTLKVASTTPREKVPAADAGTVAQADAEPAALLAAE